jgi:hypothetical protein
MGSRCFVAPPRRLTLGVDGARDAVGETDVELGEGVLGVDRGLGQVTDGGGLDHVLDRVALDGLVLRGSADVD